MSETNADLDSWDNFVGENFLKAEQVKGENHAFVVLSVKLSTNKKKDKESGEEYETNFPRLILQSGEFKGCFDLNKTNSRKCQELGLEIGIKNPKSLVGCKIYFEKALVRNPATNKEVKALRVMNITKD